MAISSVGTTQTTSVSTQTSSTRTSTSTKSSGTPQEAVSLSGNKAEELTYTDPRKAAGADGTDEVDLAGMLEDSNRKVQTFIDMLGGLLQKQGLEWSKVVSGEQKLSADPETIAAAKEAISEDGEFGVRKTAERILTFAKGMVGNDPEKLATIRDAVEKGFKQAEEIFGGKLPEISNQTHAAITAEFDRWEKEGIPSGNTVTLPKTGTTTTDSTTATGSKVA
ncbi:hypothetical protein IGB42_03592 [Andreprevotia sp. IGB-42]|uniref:hypothetical protein n=1 Tax=Andreprevotia sp. IGB-42 TaxID=2497473 RepID=UPI00135BC02C|nr:hypothetical protein [Andreprevotia sp. IGB-42]KAF0812050.1 hypothetical protein IGB42_03592 [Andreprevotia sp. IGB-42]